MPRTRPLPRLREQRKELLRLDEELRLQIAALERQLEEVPRQLESQVGQRVLAAQIRAAAETSLFDSYSPLSDKRFPEAGEERRPMRRMRMHVNAERRAFLFRCVILLVVLAVVVVWILSALTRAGIGLAAPAQ